MQERAEQSVLHATRAFLQWRKTQPALVEGSIGFLTTPANVLAFVRESESQRLLVTFNLSDGAVEWAGYPGAALLEVPGMSTACLLYTSRCVEETGHPQDGYVIHPCTQGLEDTADIGILQSKPKLDAQKPEAHIPDLPKRKRWLCGAGVHAIP